MSTTPRNAHPLRPNPRMTETVPVLYNCCYGGFNFSDRAVEEYNKRKNVDAPTVGPCYLHCEFNRTDPLMVEIVRELGNAASGKFSRVELTTIPARFANHFKINEYDGNESVQILYDQYAVDKTREILDNTSLSGEEKLEQIMIVIEQNNADRGAYGME